MFRKRIAGVALGASVALVLAACGGGGATGGSGGGGSTDDGDVTVGVAMPTKTSERWIADGNAVKAQLEEQGYAVDLQYAEDDIPTQVSQIDNMITNGADVPDHRGDRRHRADAASCRRPRTTGIPVIAYDRLIRDTENVDFYVTFDNFKVGVQQATSLLVRPRPDRARRRPMADAPTGPFNIELFAGSLDDNNAFFFFNGAMSVLQPLIDDGTLVVKSGQTDIEQVATLRWDRRDRPEPHGGPSDGDTTPTARQVDGVLSPYDGLSRGIITALTERRLRLGDRAVADRHRSGRRDRLGQGDPRGRAVRDDLQGHPGARARSPWPWSTRSSTVKSPRSTTPRRTTTA